METYENYFRDCLHQNYWHRTVFVVVMWNEQQADFWDAVQIVHYKYLCSLSSNHTQTTADKAKQSYSLQWHREWQVGGTVYLVPTAVVGAQGQVGMLDVFRQELHVNEAKIHTSHYQSVIMQQ